MFLSAVALFGSRPGAPAFARYASASSRYSPALSTKAPNHCLVRMLWLEVGVYAPCAKSVLIGISRGTPPVGQAIAALILLAAWAVEAGNSSSVLPRHGRQSPASDSKRPAGSHWRA